MASSRRSRNGLGVTLLELLVLLSVFAILVGFAAIMYDRLNDRLTLEATVSELQQTVLTARSRALASGNRHRVLITGVGGYALEEEVGGDWERRRSVDLPRGKTIAAPAAGSSITFDTRGFADFSPLGLVVEITDGDRRTRLVTAMSGGTRSL